MPAFSASTTPSSSRLRPAPSTTKPLPFVSPFTSSLPHGIHHPRSSPPLSLKRFRPPFSSIPNTSVTTSDPSPQQQPPPSPPPEIKYPVRLEALPLAPSTTLLRATCSERLPEIQFGQRLGTSTNSYIINNGEVLIDVPSKVYDYDLSSWLSDLGYLSNLRCIIITRLNPERIEPLKKVLQAAPGAVKLLASNPALQLLKDRSQSDAELKALLDFGGPVTTEAVSRTGEYVLSSNAKLKFIPVPTPRWPDLCVVHNPDEELLFSSSFFAAHEALQERSAFDEGGWDAHGASWKYYFDCMLAPAAKQAAVALDRLRINSTAMDGTGIPALDNVLRQVSSVAKKIFGGLFSSSSTSPASSSDSSVATDTNITATTTPQTSLAVSIICPIHGPIVRGSVTELVRRYGDWTAEQVAAANTASVAVLYASAYGNTAALAQAISRGITKAGVGVETLNLEVLSVEEVERALQGSAGFVIGSPTLGGHMPTQVSTALGAILRGSGTTKTLPCGVFGSFGWSGEAVDMMEGRLKDAGFQFAFPPIRCKFKPTEATLQVCEESGTDLAQSIKKGLRRRERVAAEKLGAAETASATSLAVGRVVGSLCVLTAKDGDARSGMLASWVSQASFDPPGLTVAVKKDRAVENLLPVGNTFVLNVLAEGKDRGIMKAMLKPFAPGEDRFAGLEVVENEGTGGVVFTEAAAYLECSVVQRMEAGDHWLVYATVGGGKVLDEGVQSAVHYRKSGTNY